MNNTILKRGISLLLAIAMICSVFVTITIPTQAAVTTQPAQYSKVSNSGQRDVVCTTLSGTSAGSYYTGSYVYDTLSKQSASNILSSLRTLTINKHSKTTSYSDCQDKAKYTDCENENNKVTLIYTGLNTTSTDWNREHVWPKSLGNPNLGTSGPGADMHHIRPSDNRVNSCRSALKYGNASGGKEATGGNAASGKLGGYYGTYFEPLNNVKGDVARICLYMYVRYGTSHCQSITTVFESVEVLLEWMEKDPVDTWEMGRNEVVEAIQGNRNVFIDYPEYAWLIFGEDVPANYTTPSGGKSSGGAESPEEQPEEQPGETPEEQPEEQPGETPGDNPTTPNQPAGLLATFDFGSNGNATHNDGNDITAGKSYTSGQYTLKLTEANKVYGGAYDAKGNSCLKLGASKANGSFSFMVPTDVLKVSIHVAQYKDNATKVNVNGTDYTISTASNDGAYTEISIDTSTNKQVSLKTVGSAYRCMINTIEFFGAAEEPEDSADTPEEDSTEKPVETTTEKPAETTEKVTESITEKPIETTTEPPVEIPEETPEEGEESYVLVTNVADLKAEDKVVIVAKGANYALGTNQKTSNREAVSVTKKDNTVTFGDNVQVLTLKVGTVANTFAFYTGAGYLYAASSSNNTLKTQNTNNANGSWSISIDASGAATIKAQGTYTRNLLQYNPNNGSSLFSCYASGQQSVSIYKLVITMPEPEPEPEPTVEEPKITDYSITLNRGVTVNVTCQIDAQWLADNAGANVIFKNSYRATEAEALKVGSNTFKITLKPKEINDSLKFILRDAKGNALKEYNVGVAIYKAKVEGMTANDLEISSEKYAQLLTLLDKTVAYGKAATGTLGTLTESFNGVEDRVVHDESDIFGDISAILNEQSDIHIGINTKNIKSGYTIKVTLDGKTLADGSLEKKLVGGSKLVIDGIYPADFCKTIQIEIRDENGTMVADATFTFDQYLKALYSAYPEMQTMIAATYQYGVAASNYNN